MADVPDTRVPTSPPPDLSQEEIRRYSRHLLLPEVGLDGQRRLKRSRVLCIGAGGLGSPVTMYLAAAGVGTLGLVDHDVVDYSNLQRQLLHMTRDVGRPKVESGAERLRAINPDVRVEAHALSLDRTNALDLFARYDLIVDATDNFPTRYLVNDAAILAGRPYIYGSIFRFEGQAAVFGAPGGPCYRCLYPEPPPPGLVPTCAEGGVLGVLPGIIGTIQAAEALKMLLGAGQPLVGRLLVFDALRMRFREITLRPDPDCPACGTNRTIRELQDYEFFCGLTPDDQAGAPKAVSAGDEEPDDERFNISVGELEAALKGDHAPVLLDVREPMEFQLNRLPGARLIPLGELPNRLTELDSTFRYVVYCHTGIRGRNAVRFLRGAGIHARNLEGGINAWVDQVDPSLLRY